MGNNSALIHIKSGFSSIYISSDLRRTSLPKTAAKVEVVGSSALLSLLHWANNRGRVE